MPKKITAAKTMVPNGDPEFEATWAKIESTLTSAGAPIGADYREKVAEALTKYSGKSYLPGSVRIRYVQPDDEPDQSVPPEPTELVIPARPTDPYWYDDPKDART